MTPAISSTIHRFLSAAATTALAATLTTVTSPAQAQPGCVTRGEFDRVTDGMRQGRVHQIFDTKGAFIDGGAGGYVRYYPTCRTDTVAIEYAVSADAGARVGS